VESLEGRQMLSVSVDGGGWTHITPGPGARVVYVSNSQGSDGNSGFSPDSPVKSLARGEKLVRDGAGDQLLLKRGDTWHESFGFWSISGKSQDEPVVIGAYGSGERPTVASGSASAAWTNGLVNVHDVAFIGVHFDASGRGGSTPDGIQSAGRLSNVLVEDCDIEGYRNNLTFQAFWSPIYNITVRRSVVADSYSNGSHSQGLFADGVHGVTLEENVFDHNGWGHGAGQTMFNHAAYVTAKSDGLVARGNVFSNSSSHGLQARPGGIVEDNLFYNNAIGLSYGLVNGGGVVKPGGVTGRVDNNVIIGGHSIGGLAAGVGIEVSNIASASITDNVFAYGDPSARNAAINLEGIKGTTNAYQAVGINNLTVANNVVYKWSQGMSIAGGVSVRNLVVRNNDFQNIFAFQALVTAVGSSVNWSGNTYDVPGNSKTPILVGGRASGLSGVQNTRVSYPDPGRTVTAYDANYLAKARNLSSSNWDTRYCAASIVSWIKAGFGSGNSSIPVITVPNAVVKPSAAVSKKTTTTKTTTKKTTTTQKTTNKTTTNKTTAKTTSNAAKKPTSSKITTKATPSKTTTATKR
jgi:hypothetical protein